MTPEDRAAVVEFVAERVRTFGGGRGSQDNPIAAALNDKPPMFAAGVDVGEVVDLVVQCLSDRRLARQYLKAARCSQACELPVVGTEAFRAAVDEMTYPGGPTPTDVIDRMRESNPIIPFYVDAFVASLSRTDQRGAALTAVATVYRMLELEAERRRREPSQE